jgi:hypothetical protein
LKRFWNQLEQRLGKSQGTREMITLVRAGSVAGWEQLIETGTESFRFRRTVERRKKA